MPELPEVETVRRTLVQHILQQRIVDIRVRNSKLRFGVDGTRLRRLLVGGRVAAVRRRAKYLLFDVYHEGAGSGATNILLVHLGMSGKLGLVVSERPFKKHDHVVFGLDDGRQLRFNDPRRFGMVDSFAAGRESSHARLRDLGVEPLSDAFNAELFFAQTRRVSKPVKNLLMDGKRLVGVGNIYACEALFRAGINPGIAAAKVSRARWEGLVASVKQTLIEAIEQGGTTLKDFENIAGEAGYFAVSLKVYGREGEGCVGCSGKVRRITQAGRSTFYCPRCQRR